MYSLFFVYYNGMYTYICEYMQVCISIGTDIHTNTNMKMIVVGVFMFILVIV